LVLEMIPHATNAFLALQSRSGKRSTATS
jgi:hypothetical protein